MLAARNGQLEMVNLLLGAGANDELSIPFNGSLRTVLSFAAEAGHLDVVRMLLSRNPALNLDGEVEGQPTVLYWAAEKGHAEVVDALLAADAEPDPLITIEGGETTPLRLAIENRQDAIVDMLLSTSKIDLTRWTGTRNGYFELCARFGHTDMFRNLLREMPVIPLWRANRCLQLARERGCTEIVQLLQAMHPTTECCLLTAAEKGDLKTVEELLVAGACATCRHETPLAVSVFETVIKHSVQEMTKTATPDSQYNRAALIRILKLLFNVNVNPNRKLQRGLTCFQLAVGFGRLELVRFLLTVKKLDVNAQHEVSGKTALTFAAEEGHFEIVKLLMEYKDTNPEHKDKSGNLPDQYAYRLSEGRFRNCWLTITNETHRRREEIIWPNDLSPRTLSLTDIEKALEEKAREQAFWEDMDRRIQLRRASCTVEETMRLIGTIHDTVDSGADN